MGRRLSRKGGEDEGFLEQTAVKVLEAEGLSSPAEKGIGKLSELVAPATPG